MTATTIFDGALRSLGLSVTIMDDLSAYFVPFDPTKSTLVTLLDGVFLSGKFGTREYTVWLHSQAFVTVTFADVSERGSSFRSIAKVTETNAREWYGCFSLSL